MSRYTPIHEVRFRCDRCETTWRELVAIIRKASTKPGYSGPSPASVERILADIVETQTSFTHWTAAVAAQPRRKFSAGQKAREVTMRTYPTRAAEADLATEAFREFARAAEARAAARSS